jgi:hypothetical protein
MRVAHKIVNRLLETEDEGLEGEMQRIMGGPPQVVSTDNGTIVKYPNGLEIRTSITGTTQYLFNGLLHRVDGPAITFSDGTKVWYRHGRYHREDGPAVEDASLGLRWYLDDAQISQEEHAQRTQNC